MYSLLIGCTDTDRDAMIERVWSAGTLGVVEGESTIEAFFEDDDAMVLLADLQPQRIEPEDVDWEAETRRSFPSVLVGSGFFLVPPWNEEPTPQGRQRLVINPGSACGTGYHPCTQLCVAMLEEHVRPGMHVLDVGAGSGILSKVVQLLGGHAVACDIDPDAVVQCDWLPKFVGSVDSVAADKFDLVVANISAEAHRHLLPEYRRVAKRLILSGFEEMEVVANEVERRELDGWFAILMKCEA